MTELIVVLLICVAWAITSIIIKLIERRCKHEWEDLLGYVEKHAPFAVELIKQIEKEYKLQ